MQINEDDNQNVETIDTTRRDSNNNVDIRDPIAVFAYSSRGNLIQKRDGINNEKEAIEMATFTRCNDDTTTCTSSTGLGRHARETPNQFVRHQQREIGALLEQPRHEMPGHGKRETTAAQVEKPRQGQQRPRASPPPTAGLVQKRGGAGTPKLEIPGAIKWFAVWHLVCGVILAMAQILHSRTLKQSQRRR